MIKLIINLASQQTSCLEDKYNGLKEEKEIL